MSFVQFRKQFILDEVHFISQHFCKYHRHLTDAFHPLDLCLCGVIILSALEKRDPIFTILLQDDGHINAGIGLVVAPALVCVMIPTCIL